MSRTLANLLGLVTGMAVMFGVLWTCVQAGILDTVPTDWIWSFLAVTVLIEVGVFLWRLRLRRLAGVRRASGH